MSTEDPEGSDGESTFVKKKGKKKQYPFGTPSHLHHAHSVFAHLDCRTKIFAEDLAKATGVELQALEEEKKPVRKRIVAKPKVKKDDASVGSADEDANDVLSEIPDNEGEEPCTKIPCQIVLRQIVEMQTKNQIEKLDIEDRYEMLLEDLKAAEDEAVAAETKLEKVNEVGNLLEVKANALESRVEGLEKTKDSLVSERTDITNKVMLLEMERQKLTRKMEQAAKALSDAMWRKKKAAKLQDAADGISLPPSVISDYPIIQASKKVISSANSVASTSYNRLARGVVRDYIERPPTITTVPEQIVEKMIKNSHKGTPGFVYSKEEASIDKYSMAHYRRMIESSKSSWEGQEGSIIASNVTFFRNNNPLLDGTHHHTHGHHDTYHHSYAASNAASDLLDSEDMRTVVFGPPKVSPLTGQIENRSTTTATTRMGNYLQTRSNLSTAASLDVTPGGVINNRQYDATNQSIRLTKSLNLLTPIHKPMHGLEDRTRLVAGSGGAAKKTMRLAPLSKGGSSRASPADELFGGPSIGDSSAMSALTGANSRNNQLGSSLEGDEQSTRRSTSPNRAKTALSGASVNSLFTQSSKLDPVFYKTAAITKFARNAPVGQIRVYPPALTDLAVQIPGDRKRSDDDTRRSSVNSTNTLNTHTSAASNHSQSSQVTKGGTAVQKEWQKAKKNVRGATLTVRHPGMDVFNHSQRMSNQPSEAGAEATN